MGFVESIFSLTAIDGAVPLTEYQEYCLRRFKMDRQIDTSTESGKFQALCWYLEGYNVLRKPLRTPLRGSQIKWLLESSSPYMSMRVLPRVVEHFWRKSLAGTLNPFESLEDYQAVAYWWCIEFAPHIGVEHALIPEEFVAALSAPAPGTPVDTPVCVFVQEFMSRWPEWPWSVASGSERLSIYLRLLAEPHGAYYANFFPSGIMQRLQSIKVPAEQFSALAHVEGGRVIQGLAARLDEAATTRDTLRRNRSGRHDLLAGELGYGWDDLADPPPKSSSPVVRRSAAPASSILPFPVRVIGPINSQSGLGQATRMTIDALHAVGIKPQLLDFYLDNPAPRVAFWTNDVNIDGQFAINIIHLNAESIPLAAAYLPSKLFKAARNIGYFFWELPQPARCHELAVQQLDEIWVSSEFNRETYASASNAPVLKMGIAVEPLPDTTGADLQAVRRMHGIPSEATAFLFTFDSFSFIKRKNPGAALRAFRRAFPGDENAVLIVKTHNLTKVLGEANVAPLLDELRRHADEDPRIVIIDETLSYSDLISLKCACDAYVSLHRSEGWGFGAVEAMQLGKPVIATAFSGNLEFCNEETSFLVPYTPRYLEPDDYIFVRPGDYWAEPDIATAAKAMRAVYDDPDAGRVVGARARDFVQDRFSPGAVGSRYLARLQEIASGNS